ncbi:uncharacterized protein LOC123263577 [Cotesia glomerata]|uniref:Chitin-binding type-4 domain-containing protein n=1 Tax=Cotesia glomerata TaxID=32391 RepID=A0AAV7IQU6_COTGL|nr:uncharacterized protein LOC123263577 [Cotesia glomerata]KAH0554629.1 hypothetical protein KQX54_011983 [Cotesia glomerata]
MKLWVVLIFAASVKGHGRLIEPPSRASMWRYGFDSPHDYNDNECYCGGFTRQWQRNKGNCGICGDAWDIKPPRAHETGGKYGNSIIVRKYKTNQLIPIKIQITANHRGYFEFGVCPMTTRGREVTQECLSKNILKMKNGTARYYPGPGNKIFEAYYKLPEDMTCGQCVLQWRYVAGNNWGDCGNGTGAVGCGPQEEFRGCADVTIGDNYPPLSLPETPESTKTPSSSTESPETPEFTEILPYWYLNFIIVGTTLLIVLAALGLIYLYYYHFGHAKKWLRSRCAPEPAPVAPPRQKRSSALHL